MKQEMINQEFKCIGDCLMMAEVALQQGNIDHVELMLADAMKSIKTVKELDSHGTVVLVGQARF